MTSQDLIQKHLPKELRDIASKYNIPEKYLIERSDLIILVLQSRSLAKAEDKQNWFDMFSIMNKEQIDKLNDILAREKAKLQEIEQKYEQKKEEIKSKYKERFDMYVNSEKKKEMKAKEVGIREQEMEEAESLLENI